jgi:hypothetical protein
MLLEFWYKTLESRKEDVAVNDDIDWEWDASSGLRTDLSSRVIIMTLKVCPNMKRIVL